MSKGAAGILLVHGWSGAPRDITWLEHKLNKKGFATSLVRLAGHDSSFDAFEMSGRQDWKNSVEDAWKSLSLRCRKLAFVGLSTGGTLGLQLAASAQRKPDALVTINAPVTRPSWKMSHAWWLRRFRRSVAAGPRNIEDPVVRAANPSFARLPLRSLWQLDKLIAETRSSLKQVECPLLAIASVQDGTIAPDNALKILAESGSGIRKHLLLSLGWHVATLDRGRHRLLEGIVPFLRENLERP